MSEEGKIECLLCNKSFKILTDAHMKAKHESTLQDYKKKFPKAPIASKVYGTIQKYKENKIFSEEVKEAAEEKFPEIEEFAEGSGGFQMEPDVEAEPTIEELDMKTEIGTLMTENGIDRDNLKYSIFVYLKSAFPGLKNNFMIEKFVQGNNLVYQFITDMADPGRMIDFEFTNAFWHNVGTYDDTRDTKLKKDGWTVINIKQRRPTVEYVKEIVESKLLKI